MAPIPRVRTRPLQRTQPTARVQKATNRAIAYVRVSTDEQAKHGVSLDAQLEKITAYCTLSGLDLVRVISEDGVSAAKKFDTRAGGSELSSLLSFGHAEHVVALKLDRLFRDAEDALSQTRRWDRANVALHILDLGGSTLNTASAMGRMFLTMTAGFAELERNLISERTSMALQHKKSHRKVYSPVPVGFDRSGADLVVNDGEAAMVAEIKLWWSSGCSLRQIAEELNTRGVATKRGGKRWYASTVQKIVHNKIHV